MSNMEVVAIPFINGALSDWLFLQLHRRHHVAIPFINGALSDRMSNLLAGMPKRRNPLHKRGSIGLFISFNSSKKGGRNPLHKRGSIGPGVIRDWVGGSVAIPFINGALSDFDQDETIHYLGRNPLHKRGSIGPLSGLCFELPGRSQSPS